MPSHCCTLSTFRLTEATYDVGGRDGFGHENALRLRHYDIGRLPVSGLPTSSMISTARAAAYHRFKSGEFSESDID
jgi:hypothetical protein